MSEPPTEDALLDGRVRLLQPARGYRAAIDPVLLAAAVAAEPGQEVLDVGCGHGAATLCLAARLPEVRLVGLERDPLTAALAVRGAELSGLSARVRIEVGDLADPPPAIRTGGWPWVMTNPPYHDPTEAVASPLAARAGANLEGMSLSAWIAACLRRVAPRGRIVIVHRAARLSEILAALALGAGAIEIFAVQPRAEAAAGRVVVRARKGVRSPLSLLPALVLHRRDGSYTEAAEAVLRHASALQR